MINVLNAYQIIGKVAYELQVIYDKVKHNQPVRIVGYPDDISPQDLIIYQWEKIYTVEGILKLPEQHSRDYLSILENSLCETCLQDTNNICPKDIEKKIKIAIIKEIIQ